MDIHSSSHERGPISTLTLTQQELCVKISLARLYYSLLGWHWVNTLRILHAAYDATQLSLYVRWFALGL